MLAEEMLVAVMRLVLLCWKRRQNVHIVYSLWTEEDTKPFAFVVHR
jgi:hypothetical protein